MTHCRLAYLLLLAGTFILHIMLVDYLSYFIVIFFILLPCVTLAIAAAFCRGSNVGMRIGSAVAAKGDGITLEVRVDNPSFIPVRTKVELVIRNGLTRDEEREVLIVIAGRRGGTVTQTVSFARPGKILFRIEGTGVYDPLGIFCLRTKDENRRSAGLLVLPDVVPVAGVGREGRAARDIENDGLMPVVKGDDPSELYDIREYRPGDRVTRIHWKLSDRTGRLMVRELGRVLAGDALVLLDLNGGADEADALLTAFASVSAALLEAGAAHDVEWYGVGRNLPGRDHVASAADRERAIAAVLSEGRLTPEPFVLKGRLRSGGRNPYARVIYLCSRAGLDDDDLAAFAAKMAAPEMSVVMVAGREAPPEDGGAAARTGNALPRILRVKPPDIAAALGEAGL
jgi:uncharacterized protein (DUF58 family)